MTSIMVLPDSLPSLLSLNDFIFGNKVPSLQSLP